jgi:hypothetical protein
MPSFVCHERGRKCRGNQLSASFDRLAPEQQSPLRAPFVNRAPAAFTHVTGIYR